MFRKTLLALLVLCGTMTCTLVSASPASAVEAGDVVLKIQPAEQEIDLAPNQHFRGSVEVSNIGRLPFNFTASSRPYQVLNENYDPDFTTENDYTKLHNWITFPTSDYRLEPGATVKVDFEVDVPADVPGGGQYAAIIIETRDSADAAATVRTIGQVASLIYAHVAGESHVGGVLITQKLPQFLLGSPFTSTVTIKNDGNIDFRATHQLTVRDFFTNREVFSADTVDSDNKLIGTATPIILPATTRSSRLTWEGAPQLGVFRAISHVSFLDQNYDKEQIVFICPIWLALLVLFFVFLVILWLILRLRRHHRDHSTPL